MKKFSGTTLFPAYTFLWQSLCTTPTTALGFLSFLAIILGFNLDLGPAWILFQHTELGFRWTGSQRTVLLAAYTFLGQPLCSCTPIVAFSLSEPVALAFVLAEPHPENQCHGPKQKSFPRDKSFCIFLVAVPLQLHSDWISMVIFSWTLRTPSYRLTALPLAPAPIRDSTFLRGKFKHQLFLFLEDFPDS